jgi:pSer/pThr/pTyr-binding forkhead associated (FHA) protein
MSEWKLQYEGGEFELGFNTVTVGRATDNDIAFPQDSNISRYHAEIEYRPNEYVLVDLGSSNGTAVNGKKVEGEAVLHAGDEIVLGGSSTLTLTAPEDVDEDEAESAGTISPGGGGSMPHLGSLPSASAPSISAGQSSSSGAGLMIAAGVVCGLAVVCIAAAAIFYLTRGSSCDAKAVITKPEPGDTVVAPTEVELDAENMECVSSAVYTLDGEEVARTDEQPFTITLDPKEFPELSDGLDHNLQIILIDKTGEQMAQASTVLLAFDTRVVTKAEPTPAPTNTQTQQTGGTPRSTQVSLLDVQEMSNRFVKQFSPNFKYNLNNRQFLEEVQKKTSEYATEGYFQRASQYRDPIAVAYVRENNLDAPLGFVLAMSRSKFTLDKKGTDEGLWKMSNEFVTSNGYNGPCGTETLSDPSQNCAAKASALYMKAIVYGVFDGDSIYGAAVFGKSTQDAGAWKATLPADRSDVWNVIRTPEEREKIVRFFAAGIVSENPQKFGLTKDRPLSELYRIAM